MGSSLKIQTVRVELLCFVEERRKEKGKQELRVEECMLLTSTDVHTLHPLSRVA